MTNSLWYLDHQCNCHFLFVEFFLQELWLPFDTFGLNQFNSIKNHNKINNGIYLRIMHDFQCVLEFFEFNLWFKLRIKLIFLYFESIVLRTPLTLFVRDTKTTNDNTSRFVRLIGCILRISNETSRGKIVVEWLTTQDPFSFIYQKKMSQ